LMFNVLIDSFDCKIDDYLVLFEVMI